MDKEKQANLEAAGWRVGDAHEFVGVSKASLDRYIRAARAPRASVALTAAEWKAVAKCVAAGVRMLQSQNSNRDAILHAATAMKSIDTQLKAFSAQHEKFKAKAK